MGDSSGRRVDCHAVLLCGAVRFGLALAASCCAAPHVVSTAFAAEDAGASYELNIPEQSLSASLEALALAMRVRLLYPAELINDKSAPALKGHYSLEQAVRQLLNGSGLDFEISDRLLIVRIGSATAPVNARQGRSVPPVSTAPKNYRRRTVPLTERSDEVVPRQIEAAPPEEVTITGSRLIAEGHDSPTPVTVVGIDQLQQMSPGQLTLALSMLPALLATPNQGGQGPAPQAVINLRGIGGARNLILFDGHRVSPTTGAYGVDTNLIPQMLVKRVDIVTGGASAVYGSDAVSGVVNYVVDNNFVGFRFNVQGGMSTLRDDRTFNAGVAFGTALFGGRGHAEFSYQVVNDPGVQDRFSRSWGRGLWSMQGSAYAVPPLVQPPAGSTANPWNLYGNTRLNVTSFGGLISSGPLADLQFAQNGLLSPFGHGTKTGSAQVEVGGDGGYYTTVSAFSGQNMEQAFARVSYDFTDDVKGYAEAALTSVFNWSNLANFEVRNKAIGYNNAFLASVQPAYRARIVAALADNPLGSFSFSRIITGDQFAPPRTELDASQFLLLSGIDGIWGRYKWAMGYAHTESETTGTNPNNVSNPHLFAAMNAVVDPTSGRVVCNAALANPAAYGDCVPLNLFGPTSANSASFDYIRRRTWSKSIYTTDDVTFSLTGVPMENWAGDVEMALSGEWRELSYRVKGNGLQSDAVDCAGIQFNCVQSGLGATSPYFNAATALFPKASLDVSELAHEAQIPLVRNGVFAKLLNLNTALRYTRYKTSGSVWTWKLGEAWQINDAIMLRAARSRDIRAPSLQNLFQPSTNGISNITDIHTGVTGQVRTVTEGNPDLVPEKADTWTAGVVWSPAFADDLTLSLDYYRIKINDGLNGPTPTQPASQQACENSGGTSSVCNLYIRPLPFSDRTAANFPVEIRNLTLNTAGLLAYGVDAELSYSYPLAGRNLNLRALVNYQPHLVYDLGPGGILDVGGAADGIGGLPPTPNVKGMLLVSYALNDSIGVMLQQRYRNALKQNGSRLINFSIGKLPPAWYTDLTLSYKKNLRLADVEYFFYVRNLFNRQPDPWASTGGNSQIGAFGGWAQGDDPLGRYFTLGVRFSM